MKKELIIIIQEVEQQRIQIKIRIKRMNQQNQLLIVFVDNKKMKTW